LPSLSTLSLKHHGCYAALELPTTVRTLDLEGMGIGWFRDTTSSSQRLPSLTHITMMNVEVRLPINFKMLAPNLQVLRISSLSMYDAKVGESSTVDLGRIIGPEGVFGVVEHLRELSITSMKLNHNTPMVLSLHPALKTLTLLKCRFRFGLLSSLVDGKDSDSSYLPHLTELR
ncbi:1456_t:CDS:1, partial [Acaulospora colombiana]